ncbi:hypothetical protein HOK15_05680 [Candidatus Falkowbacteria bacterium]|jgi:hypothetical protein|nr:hypothetical protein [Candidatus Falkowbacteria bacterium]
MKKVLILMVLVSGGSVFGRGQPGQRIWQGEMLANREAEDDIGRAKKRGTTSIDKRVIFQHGLAS